MQRDATSSDTTRSYGTVQVAALLGVSRPTVTRWIATGQLQAFDIGTPGRPRLRITDAALQAFITARGIGGTAA